MSTRKKPITGSIQPKDGKLYAVVNLYVDGKRKPKWIDTGFKERNGKRQAALFLQEELSKLNSERVKTDGVLLVDEDDLFTDFLKAWLPTKLTSSKPISGITYQGYEDIINGRVTQYFGEERSLTLSELEPDDFEDYYDSMYQEGLKSSTALHHHRVMYQGLKYGVKKRIIRYNVMDSVEAPADSDYVADYYKADEAKEMLQRLKGHRFYIPTLLSTYYGFRRSEVLGLRWPCVDFKAGTISIERKIIIEKENGRRVLRDTNKLKTQKSRRTLPLLDFVAHELEEEKALQARNYALFGNSKRYHKEYMEHVCVGELGRLIHPNAISSGFKELLEKEGMRPIRFHDLRHTCATLLVMGKVPLFNVAQWLGHSNSKTTENFYAHFDVKSHDSTAVVIGDLLCTDTSLIRSDLVKALSVSDQEKIALAFCQLDPLAQRKLLDALLVSAA